LQEAESLSETAPTNAALQTEDQDVQN